LEGGEWELFFIRLEELDSLHPVTPEDFLFKGAAQATWGDSSLGLKAMDEAVRRRDSSIARVTRARARSYRFMNTADPNDLALALEDALVAKSMIPNNPVALDVHLNTHLVAATAFDDAHEEAKRAAALAEAERDAQALERFPGLPQAHYARSWYFAHLGQEDTALAELRQGSEGANASSNIFYDYAVALYRRGAFEEALKALTRLDERSANFNESGRAYILAELPNGYDRALQAYGELVERKPQALNALYPQTVFRLLGRKSEAVEASRGIREQFSRMPPWVLEWYQHLLDYNCDMISEEELLKAAGKSRWHQCEAHFFIGLTLLAQGDRAAAAEHFQKSVDTDTYFFFESQWSRAFLGRLKNDPTWPPWIPQK
jgi:tetratricopeptide (TPR) repeat protein